MKWPRFRLRTLMIAVAVSAPILWVGVEIIKVGRAIGDFYGPEGPLGRESKISEEISAAETSLSQGAFAEAEACFRSASRLAEADRSRSGSRDIGWNSSISIGLADALAGQGRMAEADPLYRKAIATIEADRHPSNTARDGYLMRYANALRKVGRPEEAKECERRAVADLDQSAMYFRFDQKRQDVAEALEARATAIRERPEP